MKTAQHHPGEDLLWDYYRGALAPGLALVARSHVESCAHCRTDLNLFDAIGGTMLADIKGVEMAENALDLALARIERPDSGDEAVATIALTRPRFLEGIALPDSLTQSVIKGRYWAAPGVWIAPIEIDDAPQGSKLFLMHVKGGMKMPRHTHRGREMTLVLTGRFSDHLGEYVPGDLTVCDEELSHSPHISEDCLCLVAQDASIVPQTWLGRMLQPLANI